MVAPVPAQISKLPPRLPAAPLRHPLLTTPLCALCAPVSATSVLRFFPSSGAQASQLFCLHRTGPLCRLFALFPAPVSFIFNTLQPLFKKHPGGGCRDSSLSRPLLHYPLLTTHSPLSTFRMNTCESVSKQRTLTTFRMNTYVKRGEGVPCKTMFSATVPDAHRIM